MLELWDGTKKNDKHLLTHIDLHKTKQQVGYYIIETFLVLRRTMGKLKFTRFTMTRTWGKLTPSLILFSMISHVGYIQMSFFQDSQVKSLEIPEIETLATLKAHNFLCKHSIEVRCKTKLYFSSRSFQRYVACHLHTHISS